MLSDILREGMPRRLKREPGDGPIWEVFKREYPVLAYNLLMGTDRPDTFSFWYSFRKAYRLGFDDGAKSHDDLKDQT